MLSLSVTANKFNKRPSELLDIDDPGIALAFDIECAEILFEWEAQQRANEIEAMMTGQVVNQLGKASKQIPTITEANFRNQAW